jgi:phenylalanyl-tRNA synthetase alpha subunit
LGAIAETTTDGLISLNAAEVEAFISGKEEELNTSIDTKISELEAEKAALQTELDLKQKDLEAAQALAEGKLELENVSAQYLTDLRKNLTQYFLDLGMDEVTANAAALETMGVNEEEYSQLVADACETNATNMTYAAEDGANAQVASLGQLV